MTTLSLPANPGIPSFLDLPAETRNWIYEFFFCHLTPLYLSEARDKSVTLLQHWTDCNYGLKRRVPRAPHDDIPAPRWCNTVASLVRASQPGLQLLRVCHQIHQEAASILYANAFCIVPKYDSHPTYYDNTGQYMNQTTTSWLRQIGQHRFFVRKLIVDLGSICYMNDKPMISNNSQTFRTCDGFLQFGALLDAVWASDQRMDVTLIDPKPHPSCHISQDLQRNNCTYFQRYSDSIKTNERNLEKLNAVFKALCNDELGMRKFRRAIRDVGITKSASYFAFVLWTPVTRGLTLSDEPEERNPHLDHARLGRCNDDGSLQLFGWTPTQLSFLPNSVLTQIMSHLFSSSSRHIDLDSFVDFRKSCGILYSCKTFHHRYTDMFLLNTFDLSMMSSEAYAMLDFSKLERLLQTEFKCRCSTTGLRIELHFGSEVKYSISIHIYSSTPSLKNIRINIMALAAATFAANGSRPVRILLHTGDTRIKTQPTSIRRLRQIALKALTKYVKIDNRTDFRVKCPEIWINGHGDVVDIVSTGTLNYPGCKDPVKTNRTLWSAERTGYVGAKPKFRQVPNTSDLARKVYLWLKWVVSVDDWENGVGTED
jgi:hypothetical protein